MALAARRGACRQLAVSPWIGLGLSSRGLKASMAFVQWPRPPFACAMCACSYACTYNHPMWLWAVSRSRREAAGRGIWLAARTVGAVRGGAGGVRAVSKPQARSSKEAVPRHACGLMDFPATPCARDHSNVAPWTSVVPASEQLQSDDGQSVLRTTRWSKGANARATQTKSGKTTHHCGQWGVAAAISRQATSELLERHAHLIAAALPSTRRHLPGLHRQDEHNARKCRREEPCGRGRVQNEDRSNRSPRCRWPPCILWGAETSRGRLEENDACSITLQTVLPLLRCVAVAAPT